MPVLKSYYNPPLPFKNGHFSTIYSGLVRRVEGLHPERERIVLPDGDFLDTDWHYAGKKTHKLAIVLHGLEGNASRPYVQGAAKAFNRHGYDALNVNFRSCSEQPNNLYRSYHSGATEDLHQVIDHVLNHYTYDTIIINGFSLGGNITLKYLGEREQLPSQIKAGIAVSVPCHLHSAMLEIHSFKNTLYARRFKKNLLGKLKIKQQQFPDKVSEKDVLSIKTLKDFDDFYTSRAHGFKDALDYYERSSSLQFLKSIKTPAYILNARNDSFLSEACFPVEDARENTFLHLEISKYGGHVGFFQKNNIYYNEKRSVDFLKSLNL